MKLPIALVLAATLVLSAGCKDQEKPVVETPTVIPTEPADPLPKVGDVKPGGLCSPEGAVATTSKGVHLACVLRKGDSHARWREVG